MRAVVLEDVTRRGRSDKEETYAWWSGRILSEDNSGMKKPNAVKEPTIQATGAGSSTQRE